MRTSSIHGSFEKTIWKLIPVLLISIFLTITISCATTGKYRGKKIEKVRDQETNVVKEVIKNEPKQYTTPSTPKARASSGLIENGRRSLTGGDFDTAENYFQEAINVDPNNGIAYYYLAKVKYELNLLQQALGILDKAEALLSASKEWSEAIIILRDLIKGGLN